MVTIKSKDQPNTKVKYSKSLEYKKSLEDKNEDYIKKQLGIKE